MVKKTFLHVEIPAELATRLKATIPQGMQSSIVRLMMESLASEIEINGHGVLGLILSKEFSVKSIVQILNNREEQDGPLPLK